MDVSNLVQTVAIYALPVLFAITLHEAAHGYVARHFGDMTAYAQGRISLNPARHIDLVGTILVPIAILVASKLAGTTGFLFGWAKPVPVNYSALRNPKRSMMWVAAAGPASNLVMAIGWAVLYKLAEMIGPGEYATPLKLMSAAGIEVNVVLMLLNLLPILPLDGGHIVFAVAEKLKGSAFSAATYGKASFVGFAIVMVIFAIALQNDIGRLTGEGFQVK